MSARLQMILVALLFSTGGAAVKCTSLDAWVVAGGRSLVAAVLVALVLPAAGRSWSRGILVCGAAYAATLVLFVHANRLTTATAAVFLQATAPLYVVVVGPRLLGEPVRRRDGLLIVGLVGAVVLLLTSTEPAQASAPAPMAGAVLAALSAVGYAGVVVGLRALQRRGGPAASEGRAVGDGARAVLCGNCMAVAVCTITWWLTGGGPSVLVGAIGPLDVGIVLYLGLFQVGGAYLLMLRATRRLRALEISLLLLIEPLASPLWAWLVHGETASAGVWIGGFVALLTLALHAVVSARSA